MNINDLPDELLLLVFTHLKLRSRSCAQSTCHRWRNLMQSLTSQPPIRLMIADEKTTWHLFPEPPYLCGFPQCYDWDNFVVRPEYAVSLLKQFNRGEVLFLWLACNTSLTNYFDVIEEEWRQLKNLQLFLVVVDYVAFLKLLQRPIAERITRVYIPSSVPLGVDVMPLLFGFFVNIEGFYFEDQREFSDTLVQLPPQLRTLFLPELEFTDEQLTQFFSGSGSQLQSFCIRSCSGSQLGKICNKMDNLVTLRFTLSVAEPSDLSPLGQLKKLRNLSVACWSCSLAVKLLDVLSKCSNLRTLALVGNCISAEVVEQIPNCVPQIEALDLWGNEDHRVFSKAMEKLPQLAPMAKLKALQVPFTSEYFESAATFIEKSASIRNIDGQMATGEVDQKLFEEMSKKANANKNMQFRLRTNITRRNLKKVAKNLILYFRK